MRTSKIERIKSRHDHVFGYAVIGRGHFPTDMLRYDRAWLRRTEDAVTMWGSESRRVELLGLREPTIDRWRSFGWTVETEEG